ncbi:MAG: hypothetical protein IJ418_02395 [Clostridia bacterium]|nr:hypothetical protein [Clostridia bacterium]
MKKAVDAVLVFAVLIIFTVLACYVNDEVFGLFTVALWASAGVAKLLAAHEEYRTSR